MCVCVCVSGSIINELLYKGLLYHTYNCVYLVCYRGISSHVIGCNNGDGIAQRFGLKVYHCQQGHNTSLPIDRKFT